VGKIWRYNSVVECLPGIHKVLGSTPSSKKKRCGCDPLVYLTLNTFHCGGSTGVWTQGFSLASQAFYCLSHTSCHFCFGCFGGKVWLFGQAGPRSSYFTYLAVAGMTGMCHSAQLFPLRWGLANFFPQAGLKPWSFWFQPPRKLGLQAWTNGVLLCNQFL
jgi:hypothetical protein